MFCVWVFCLHARLCTMCLFDHNRGQKKVLNTLELELQVFVGHHVGARNQT